MSLRLVVEHSPHQQPEAERVHHRGDLSIGRGEEADWRLQDPEMFISRKHCLIAGEGDGYVVTDMSRGGLFVDGAEMPLGAGRSLRLSDGMRLRLGDVVLRVDLRADASAPAGRAAADPKPSASSFLDDDFFAPRAAAEPLPRPPSLPESFEAPRERVRGSSPGTTPAWHSPFDDDLLLGPLPTPSPPSSTDPLPARPDPAPASGWDWPPVDVPVPPVAPERSVETPLPAAQPPRAAEVREAPAGDDPVARPSLPVPEDLPRSPSPASPAVSTGAADLTRALLVGMGLDPSKADAIGPAEMEVIGRRFRGLVQVLEQSLRTRAREKLNLRVAQTVIGSAHVNPLKFLPRTEDVLDLMIGPARPGYLDADDAIAAAGRDLADHQLRSWSGLQSALRRMVDRFDPQEIERDLEEAGRLRTILAGGRSALLWQLYLERFKSIAKAAEDRFLGEVGRDFREAYEGGGTDDADN